MVAPWRAPPFTWLHWSPHVTTPCCDRFISALRAAGKPALRKLAELANLLLKNPQLVIAQ
jgi:hypothetical protein